MAKNDGRVRIERGLLDELAKQLELTGGTQKGLLSAFIRRYLDDPVDTLQWLSFHPAQRPIKRPLPSKPVAKEKESTGFDFTDFEVDSSQITLGKTDEDEQEHHQD